MEKIIVHLENLLGQFILYGIKLIIGIGFLIVGLWVIKRLDRYFINMLERRHVDVNLRPFLSSLFRALLKVMLFISAGAMVGIKVTSFIAVLGAAGFAVGLALQGSLANFAGGVLILLLKPFKVGDYIETDAHSGTVREIQIFYTFLTTVERQEVVIPNGDLSNNAVKNYSYHKTRRFDRVFKIRTDEDLDKAKNVIEEIVKKDTRFLKQPEHYIFIDELGDHYVNLHLRAWLSSSDFWDVSDHLNEVVKKAFEKEGIKTAVPVQEVQVLN